MFFSRTSLIIPLVYLRHLKLRSRRYSQDRSYRKRERLTLLQQATDVVPEHLLKCRVRAENTHLVRLVMARAARRQLAVTRETEDRYPGSGVTVRKCFTSALSVKRHLTALLRSRIR